MKPAQMILVLGLLVLLVFGATFVSMYFTPANTEQVNNPGDNKAATKLTLTWNAVAAPKGSDEPALESEFHQRSYQYFWFENQNQKSVRIGAVQLSCQCSSVSLFQAPPSFREDLKQYGLTAAQADGQAGFIPSLLADYSEDRIRQMLGDQLAQMAKEHELKNDNAEGVVIPPGGFGVVQLQWKGKPEGTAPTREQSLSAELWTGNRDGQRTRLYVRTRLLNPVLAAREMLTVGVLEPREERTVSVECWSATREKFDLKVAVEGEPDVPEGERLVVIEKKPLTRAELATVSGTLAAEAKSGYRVTALVRERSTTGKRRMPQGPFLHTVDLTVLDESGKTVMIHPDHQDASPFQVRIQLRGDVEGDFSITDDRGHNGFVDMSAFKVRRGAQRVATIRAEDPRKKYVLKLDQKRRPWFVKASLEEIKPEKAGEGQRWKLNLEIPRNLTGFGGRFPRDEKGYEETSLYLLVEGAGGRQEVRIPVVGEAQR